VTWDESVQLWVGRLPRDERGRRPKVSGKTKTEAQRRLREKLREREQGIAASAGRTTVRVFLEEWIRNTILPGGLADQTKSKYEIAVRCHILPGLGRVQLVKLTPLQVQRWIRDELEAGKNPPTVQTAHSVLRRALEQAVLWGLVSRNVARLVASPAYEAPERDPFTRQEQAAILRIARADRLYVMVVLAQATGFRQSELLGIRWTSLDLERGVLHAHKQLGRNGRLKNVKSEAGKRAVPLPPPVVAILREHCRKQEQERAGASAWEDNDLVICTRTGRPVSQRNAHRSWTRILAQAGVPHRGIHHMRHAYLTMLAEHGVHERVAQQLAGHADSRITREVYTHVTGSMLDGATAAIVRAAEGLYEAGTAELGPGMGPGADASGDHAGDGGP
jgi:integrase